MTENALSWVYFPTAFILGALHALEPGHAKTVTAAYLVGIRGTLRDAVILGLSVAITHSLVVISLAGLALYIGQSFFAEDAANYLQKISGIVVIALGSYLLWSHIRHSRLHSLDHSHHHHSHHHDVVMPDYVEKHRRPSLWQIIMFGAAGGLVPCTASISVMILAVSVGKVAMGLFTLLGFSLGLAVTLVVSGLIVVQGLRKLQGTSYLIWVTKNSPALSAILVILSGIVALIFKSS